jgi:transcription elongation factor Elf1
MIVDHDGFNGRCPGCGQCNFADDAITVFVGETADTARKCGWCGEIVHTDKVANAFKCPKCAFTAFVSVDESDASAGFVLVCGKCGLRIRSEDIKKAVDDLKHKRITEGIANLKKKFLKS